ncbi:MULTISPECIES: peptide deformylase [Sulfurospirillum]|jgi:peptide deformylase|uniref:Peptide deformylase n=1 Tax=Sulfurospirillum cavolei TaxID=366522 RepID=A0A2D3W855_9BACT|nr:MULTISPECIES: peptide deformylase [Sulfurospirillum]MCP3652914.1 peptide deformylase [Sulfurospirillum sp. DNRA8]MCR1811766.1 peptide deformylase [Sulfurospirillum sp. DNRA8]DAB36065.1 MAG TPA: peptide deformylase [Sulfurospirillum cavolei]
MILEILVYPHKLLREKSKDVTVFDSTLHTLLDNMYDTMVFKEGIGLAAIQVGFPLNALLINLVDEDGLQKKENLYEILNPEILEKDGAVVYQEGCLSVPGYYDEVERAAHIKLAYYDRYGQRHEEEFRDLMAIAVQHEMDHLRGHLFIEKLSYLKRKKFEKEWKKKQKEKA